MTKQEKIKEAWVNQVSDKRYSDLKEELVLDGFLFYQPSDLIEVDTKIIDGLPFYRPKSLQGIENNNGWTKINSINDLPKETDHYLVFNKFSNCIQVDYIDWDYESHIERWMEFNSHYQPIEKTKPPLY